MTLIKLFNITLVYVLLFVFMFIAAANTFALSSEQRSIFRSGIGYYDTQPEQCTQTSPVAFSPALPTSSSVYIVGDSILVQSQNEVTAALEEKGFDVSINAQSGRAVSVNTTENGNQTGIEAVAADANIIGSSEAVIVALGANSGTEELDSVIPQILQKIREANSSVTVYWVELFYEGESVSTRNDSIKSFVGQTTSTGEKLIDSLISTSGAGIQLRDGVHPTTEGRKQFADALTLGLNSTSTNAIKQPANSSGLCVCSQQSGRPIGIINNPAAQNITWGEGVWGDGSEKYVSGLQPPYTKEQWAIAVLDNIARKAGLPREVMVTKSKVVSMIAWSLAEGGGVQGHVGSHNPLNTKARFDDIPSENQGDSGNDANSQGYQTFDDGVEAITRALFNGVQKRIAVALIQDGISPNDFIEAVAGNFEAVPYGSTNTVNNWEDLYPGDLVYAALSITGYRFGGPSAQNGGIGDRELFISIKQSTLKNTQNNYESFASQKLDQYSSSSSGRVPYPGETAPLVFSGGSPDSAVWDGGSCQQSGGGAVNAEGYAFPLEIPDDRPVGGIPCSDVATCHHDKTAAFDITYIGVEGRSVYAIRDGEIDKVGVQEEGWCYSVQLKANDSYFYWYGHLVDVTVQKGDDVRAGQEIGKVANWEPNHTCNGTSGGPHLHIDRGCVIQGVHQRGGGKRCRDPEFIPLLNEIYESLPEKQQGSPEDEDRSRV